MIRHTIHDSPTCRLVVEVQVGIVVLTLWFGVAGIAFNCYQTTNLAPNVARDRIIFSRAVAAAEFTAGIHETDKVARRTPLDVIHRSIMDITRRPSA